MDAVSSFAQRVRALAAALVIGSAVGCALLTPSDEPADPAGGLLQRATHFTADAATGSSVARPQAPAEPTGPISLPGPIETTPTVRQTATTVTTEPTVFPAGEPTPDQATTQVRVVAMIGTDVVITDDEVWQMVRQKAFEYVRLTGTERAAREKEMFREELRRLIERELVLSDFLGKIKKQKPQVLAQLEEETQQMARRQIKEFKKHNNITNEAQFTEAMKIQGLTIKSLRRQLERNAMMQIYMGQFLHDLGKRTSLAEVRLYYDSHPDQLRVEDRAKWLDLFISYRRFANTVEARRYADDLLRRARAGEDFVKLVKEHGHGDSVLRDGEGAGQKHGEITPPELEPVVFSMTAGQIKGPIATETGFHIVKVLERDVAGMRPFDETTQSAIRARLAALAQKAEYEKLIETLWRKTTVKVMGLP
jgi:hypothetical protein